MDAFFNPLLNSSAAVASVHERATWNVGNEAIVVVTGRTAAAVAIPNLQDASGKLGKTTLVRTLMIMNRSTENVTVSVAGGGLIDGSRAVTIRPGQTALLVAVPDPTQPANIAEYAVIIV